MYLEVFTGSVSGASGAIGADLVDLLVDATDWSSSCSSSEGS